MIFTTNKLKFIYQIISIFPFLVTKMNALLSVALISTVAVAMEAPHNSDEIIEEPDYDLCKLMFEIPPVLLPELSE